MFAIEKELQWAALLLLLWLTDKVLLRLGLSPLIGHVLVGKVEIDCKYYCDVCIFVSLLSQKFYLWLA